MGAFNVDPKLTKLRKYNSHSICHEVVILEYNPKRKKGRVKCVFCSTATCNRNTKFQCNTCNIPLRTTLLRGKKNQETCFVKWHKSQNLADDSIMANATLIDYYKQNKNPTSPSIRSLTNKKSSSKSAAKVTIESEIKSPTKDSPDVSSDATISPVTKVNKKKTTLKEKPKLKVTIESEIKSATKDSPDAILMKRYLLSQK